MSGSFQRAIFRMPVAFEDFFTQIVEHDTPSQLTVPDLESFWVEGGGSITRRDRRIVHKYRAASKGEARRIAANVAKRLIVETLLLYSRSEVASSDSWPLPWLHSLLRLTQCNLPLLAGVFFSIPPNGVSDFEAVMHYATKGGCIADIWKLLRRRFANWANEGHLRGKV